jgi:hypothetical protein
MNFVYNQADVAGSEQDHTGTIYNRKLMSRDVFSYHKLQRIDSNKVFLCVGIKKIGNSIGS